MLRLIASRHAARALSGCGGGAAPPPKKKGVLELFKSLGGKKDLATERAKNDPHARALLGVDNDAEYQGHAHGDHARALERDLLEKVSHGHSHDGHGHSHGDGEHGHSHGEGDHGHSHGEHGHSHAASKGADQLWEEDPEDFIEMWNDSAPAGPEHGGPRGLEPTRYGNEWEKKGRVTDFS